MEHTRERILQTALHLFAQNGFEAVSTSQIAGQLGITKGALYRHYQSKRDIFEAILRRMEQNDREKAEENDVPPDPIENAPEPYRQTSLADFIGFAKQMFRYWTSDPFAADFRRLLTLEQHRDAEMMALYQQYLAGGPLGYTADFLTEAGLPAPREKAAALYGAMFLLYTVYDGAEDKRPVEEQLDAVLDGLLAEWEALQ